MLCLTRGKGESIVIGDATVMVLAFPDGKRVRLGIEAPREVPVNRKEIFDQIIRERGPFPETRRVPVELLRRIAASLACVGDGAAKEREELDLILEPRKDG